MGTRRLTPALWGIFSLVVAMGMVFLGPELVRCHGQNLPAQVPQTIPTTVPASQPSGSQDLPKDGVPAKIKILGRIVDPAITECSGIVASRKYSGVFWVHNDSGNPANLYAIDRDGKTLATFSINARNTDWEDIAIDDQGLIYLADTGNNSRKRVEVQVIRLAEPDPRAPVAADGRQPAIQPQQVYRLRYPAQPFDCEAMFVLKDKGYLFSKNLDGRPSTMYSFSLSARPDQVQMLQVVTDVPIRVPVTGADVSPDGNELAIQTVTGPHLIRIAGDPAAAGKTPGTTSLYISPTLESVCFVPDGLLGAAEDRTMILWPRGLFMKAPPVGQAPQGELHPARRTIRLKPAPEKVVVDGDLAEWIASPANEISLRIHSIEKARAGKADAQSSDSSESAAGGQAASQSGPAGVEPGTVPPSSAGNSNLDQAEAYAQFLDHAQLWCGWTAEGLYLAAKVPTRQLKPLRENWFSGDCIEMFFGVDNPRRDSAYGWGDFRCYAGLLPPMPDSKAIMGPAVIRFPFLGDRVPEGVKVSASPVAGGYAMEIFLPANCLNQALDPISPAPEGSVIMNPNAMPQFNTVFSPPQLPAGKLKWSDHLRMEVSILRQEPAENWYICSSNEAGSWMTPLLWSTAVLD